MHGHKATDMVWKTCCALHNWLLDIDGLDERWTKGVHSPLEGELGHFDTDDLELIPEHIRNCHELYDLLPCGYNVDKDGGDNSADKVESNEECNANMLLLQTVEEPMPSVASGQVRMVRKLSNDQFRSRLVEHFDILYKKNAIKWPRRLGSRPPAIPCNHQHQSQF